MSRSIHSQRSPLAIKLANAIDLSSSDEQVLFHLGADRRRIAAGRDIISDGERPRGVQLILKGWACRYKIQADGTRQITAILLPGDFCDLHITMLNAMDHGIAALSSVVVARMTRAQLDAAVSDQPNLKLGFDWITMVDIGTLRAWLTSMGQSAAISQVAHLICELYQRMTDIGLTEGMTFKTELTQLDIAAVTGLTPVHVSRVIKEMRKRNMIILKAKSITIVEHDVLQHVGLFDPSYLHVQKLVHR